MDNRNRMDIQPNFVRRRTALVFLALTIVMLLVGLLLWSRLKGFWFLGYWLVCFVFLAGAMISAFLDLRDIRRQSREQQVGLMEQAFDDVAAEVKEARDKERTNRRK